MYKPFGHNGGPPLVDCPPAADEGARFRLACWERAHEEVWRNVPREIVLMRLARAERLGLTYREYTLEVLERGRHLQEADADRIEAIIARRGVRP